MSASFSAMARSSLYAENWRGASSTGCGVESIGKFNL